MKYAAFFSLGLAVLGFTQSLALADPIAISTQSITRVLIEGERGSTDNLAKEWYDILKGSGAESTVIPGHQELHGYEMTAHFYARPPASYAVEYNLDTRRSNTVAVGTDVTLTGELAAELSSRMIKAGFHSVPDSNPAIATPVSVDGKYISCSRTTGANEGVCWHCTFQIISPTQSKI